MIVKRQVDQYWCERRLYEEKFDLAKETYVSPNSRWYPDMFPKIVSIEEDQVLRLLYEKFTMADQKYEIASAAYEKQIGQRYYPPVI